MDIDEIVHQNRNAEPIGLPCFCTSNPYVIDATLEFAAANSTSVVIEATCNQVNQFGGYTGMQPVDFATKIRARAIEKGVAEEDLILGGDHLGPEPWKTLPAEEAMKNAEVLVREFARAGFTKIHLDASMSCGGEPLLSARTVAERAAKLCKIVEGNAPDPEKIRYIIGTEVPVPGGETTDMGGLVPTSADSLEETIATHENVFAARGLSAAFARVVSVVVQPGADFSHQDILPYERKNAEALSQKILATAGLTFEAHSTDYQPDQSLTDLVSDHFAFLKVGPELTFAFREAVFALASIEEVLGVRNSSNLLAVLQAEMQEDPSSWQGHYSGDTKTLEFLRWYSFSDRVRYYWDKPSVKIALTKLIENLTQTTIPYSLVTQFLGVRIGSDVPVSPHELITRRIQQTVERYYRAGNLLGHER